MLSRPIDDERYDRSRRCTRAPRAGTLALQAWLERNARGASWGIMRCERLSAGSFSLHADGRALDWHLDASNPADRREAERLIALMLAPDQLGNAHALARRMGLQEIIWDCRSWWAGSEGMDGYSVCLNGAGELRRRIDVDDRPPRPRPLRAEPRRRRPSHVLLGTLSRPLTGRRGRATLGGAGQAAAAGETSRRGKSGHHRAGWSGNRPGETRGKVPQKHTADGAATAESRTGKGEMVR